MVSTTLRIDSQAIIQDGDDKLHSAVRKLQLLIKAYNLKMYIKGVKVMTYKRFCPIRSKIVIESCARTGIKLELGHLECDLILEDVKNKGVDKQIQRICGKI